MKRIPSLIVLAGLSITLPANAQVSIDLVKDIMTTKLLSSDIYKCDAYLSPNVTNNTINYVIGANYTLTYNTFFYPTLGVEADTLMDLKMSNMTPAAFSPAFNKDIPPADYHSSFVKVVGDAGPTYRYVSYRPLNTTRFAEECGVLGKCKCLVEGISTATRAGVSAREDFAKFEVLVAKYVKDSISEISSQISDAERDAFYQSLIQIMNNNTEKTNRVIDITLSRLSDPKDDRIAKLIASKMMGDDNLRRSIEAMIAKIVAKRK